MKLSELKNKIDALLQVEGDMEVFDTDLYAVAGIKAKIATSLAEDLGINPNEKFAVIISDR